MRTSISEIQQLERRVEAIVAQTPVIDIHTHLYDPAFGGLLLWGIDDLLVYHYLVSEAFRHLDIPYDRFWALPKTGQADLVWEQLFLRHSPVSESCRGVLTSLQALGLDARKKDLPALRKWFAAQKPEAYVTRCLELAGVSHFYMTNSPLDDLERPTWEQGFRRDGRVLAALRLDPLLLDWKRSCRQLAAMGYAVTPAISRRTVLEVRRFLEDWTKRMGAKYLMVSLPPEYAYPDKTECNALLELAVLPHGREHGLPMALMLGVRRAVNPELRLAGDGVGVSDLQALSRLCSTFTENKFLATVLSPVNIHELCVVARKFRNLHVFGCWWFTNVVSQIEDITRLRLELLGLSFTPQHSDARVLDQLIYKWRHTRQAIAPVLAAKYADLARSGWVATDDEIRRDVRGLFGGAFEKFLG